MKTIKRAVTFLKNIGKFKIKDRNGNIVAYASEPTALYNQDCGTLIHIGEFDDVTRTYERYMRLFAQNQEPEVTRIADNLTLVRIPPLQKTVDRVVQEEGYIKTLHEQIERALRNQPRYFAS